MDDTELQRWIARHLRGRRDLTTQPELVAEATRYLRSDLGLKPAEQLEVYRQQFWLRHTAALLEDFPALAALLGQARWERLVELYLEQVELTSFSLRDLGHALPDFVGEQAWLDERPLAADVARFEWALVEAFDAADAPPITPLELAQVDEAAWPSAGIALHPALRLLALRYDAPRIAALVRAGSPMTEASAPSACALAVYRSELVVSHERLEPGPFFVLSALAQDVPLAAACEAAVAQGAATEAELTAQVAGWFEAWARAGWVVGVRST